MPVIDFPSSPTEGDELQAPNKFVYKWVTNRWKNIPRPLVIPDYIWPDISDPSDPYGTGETITNDDETWANPISPVTGGGGDDWILEMIEMPITDGESNIITLNLLMNQTGVEYSPFPGSDRLERCTDYIDGGLGDAVNLLNSPEAHYPYIANRARAFSGTADPIAQSRESLFYQDITPGDAWVSFKSGSIIGYDVAYPGCLIPLQDVLTESGYANRSSVKARMSTSFSFAGKYSGFYNKASIGVRGVTGETISGGDHYQVDGSSVSSYTTVERLTTDWIDIDATAEYLIWEGTMSETREMGDVVIEINDPYSPPDPAVAYPVGFATNPEHTKSSVVFDGTGGSKIRTIKHGDPMRLTNSSYDQLIYCNTMADLVTGVLGSIHPHAFWAREDDNWISFVDDNNNHVVEGRRLYTSGDYSTHSEMNGSWDFKNEGSRTPNLGYEVTNFSLNPDGTLLFTLDTTGNIRSYTMTAWDLSTVVSQHTLDMGGWGASCFDITQDGNVIVIIKAGNARQIIMDTSWDLSTSYDSGYDRYFDLDNPIDVCVSADTGSIFVLDNPTDPDITYRIYNYTRYT